MIVFFISLLFAKAYLGDKWEQALSVAQTADGDIVVTGYSHDTDNGNNDAILLKLSPDGSVKWAKVFDGDRSDFGFCVIPTADGGFAVAGSLFNDLAVLKFSADDSLEWVRAFGGTSDERAYSLIQTSDGGFAVVGYTMSFGAGYEDALVLKLSADGSLEWAKVFGTSSYDHAYFVIQTSDGGFLVFGDIYSKSMVLKLSPDGSLEWVKGFRGFTPASAVQVADGFVVGGVFNDVIVLKLSPDGSVDWARAYGGDGYDWTRSIIKASDGGFVVVAESASFGDYFGALVLKLLPDGSVDWAKVLGGESFEARAYSVTQASDGSLIVVGSTTFAGDTSDRGDFLVFKLSPDGTYEGCVADCELTDSLISPETTAVNLSVVAPDLAVDSPEASVYDTALQTIDICEPYQEVYEPSPSTSSLFSLSPGGLLFLGEKPGKFSLYSVDGRLVASGVVKPKEKISLKRGVYIWRVGGREGVVAVP